MSDINQDDIDDIYHKINKVKERVAELEAFTKQPCSLGDWIQTNEDRIKELEEWKEREWKWNHASVEGVKGWLMDRKKATATLMSKIKEVEQRLTWYIDANNKKTDRLDKQINKLGSSSRQIEVNLKIWRKGTDVNGEYYLCRSCGWFEREPYDICISCKAYMENNTIKFKEKEARQAEEISKNVINPAKLSFQEQYPQTSIYKTPEYIENLRKEKEAGNEPNNCIYHEKGICNLEKFRGQVCLGIDNCRAYINSHESRDLYDFDATKSIEFLEGYKTGSENSEKELIAEFQEKLQNLLDNSNLPKSGPNWYLDGCDYLFKLRENIEKEIKYYKEARKK